MPPGQRQQLFVRKLVQCQTMFDFNDPSCDLRGKEIKRQALQEMLEYVATTRNVITDQIYPDVIRMVRIYAFARSINRLRIRDIYTCGTIVYGEHIPFNFTSKQTSVWGRRCGGRGTSIWSCLATPATCLRVLSSLRWITRFQYTRCKEIHWPEIYSAGKSLAG